MSIYGIVPVLVLANVVCAQPTWTFTPERDPFDEDSLLDLRYLNEDFAGQSGWLQTTPDGGFALGNGEPVRFWAVGSGVNEADTRDPRPRPGWPKMFHDHHARWLAKRGVNMVRIHAFINPDPSQPMTSVNEAEVEWVWRTVGAMKAQGIYSTLSTDVLAVNRYFTGLHLDPNPNKAERKQGWAVEAGHIYTNQSALIDGGLDFPVNLKQVAGKPMIVTESTWVFPNEHAFESPLLLASYLSLTGVDSYYWFSSGTDDFEQPRSANGYLQDSQAKWLCMTPDMAGQWPAAALAFRQGYIQKGEPVVHEHRALHSLWERRSPIIAETASFDPNRDTGNLPPDTSIETGVTPWAYFAGPVQVTYGSSETYSTVADELDSLVQESGDGMTVTSNTGQLQINTDKQCFQVDAPRIQGLVSHQPTEAQLSDLRIKTGTGGCAVAVVSLDGLPLRGSRKMLVQVGTRARPTGWSSHEDTLIVDDEPVSGLVVDAVGQAPWAVDQAEVEIVFQNLNIESATVLDMNGVPVEPASLSQEGGETTLTFPDASMYVLVEASGLSYNDWSNGFDWQSPATDSLDFADPENDGLNNTLEYALASHPLHSNPEHLPRARFFEDHENRYFGLDFRRSVLAGDIEFLIETSTDMQSWNPLPIDGIQTTQEVVHPDVDGNGFVEMVQIKAPLPDLSPSTSVFIRLKVANVSES